MNLSTGNGNNIYRLGLLILLCLISQLITTSQAVAGGPTTMMDDTVKIPIFKSRNLTMDEPVHRVSVGNPDIADILILRSKELYIVGKKLGTTNMMVWDKNDKLMDVVNLEVTHDLNTLRLRLHEYLPNENIGVRTSQGQLVVSGESSSLAKMNTAVELARAYAQAAEVDKSKSEVLNMISIGGGQQVMLEVTVAEVSTEISRKLDSNILFGLNGADGAGGIVSGGDLFATIANGGIPFIDKGIIASFLDGDMLFSLALDLAKKHGMAKVLAEPNITALSGQKAEFLSGGEFPVPVPDRDGTIIEYRDFGVGVGFVPTILDSGKINLNLKVIVSEISNANSIGITPFGSTASLVVPSLVKRTAETTVELGDGQTIAIGGLLSDNLRETVNKIPGLGDIPVLGQLFTSQEFVSGQSELMIMVTPRLVRPFNKEGVPLPTDGFVPVSDLEFYLLGRMTRQEKTSEKTTPNQHKKQTTAIMHGDGGTEQRYGHELRTTEEL